MGNTEGEASAVLVLSSLLFFLVFSPLFYHPAIWAGTQILSVNKSSSEKEEKIVRTSSRAYSIPKGNGFEANKSERV